MNALNSLDGKSVAIGALVVGGLVATQGGLVPVLLVGGVVYLVGGKMGWWGNGSRREDSVSMRHRPAGVPPFFDEWHRQIHANESASPSQPGQPATDQPPASHPATPAPAPEQPREAEVRIPVTPAPTAPVEPSAMPEPTPPWVDNRPTASQGGAPPAY